jgi:hypothetical protein
MTVSSSYWYFLIALAAAALITRLAVDALPVRAISYRPGRGEAIWAAGSVLALAVLVACDRLPSGGPHGGGRDDVLVLRPDHALDRHRVRGHGAVGPDHRGTASPPTSAGSSLRMA